MQELLSNGRDVWRCYTSWPVAPAGEGRLVGHNLGRIAVRSGRTLGGTQRSGRHPKIEVLEQEHRFGRNGLAEQRHSRIATGK